MRKEKGCFDSLCEMKDQEGKHFLMFLGQPDKYCGLKMGLTDCLGLISLDLLYKHFEVLKGLG